MSLLSNSNYIESVKATRISLLSDSNYIESMKANNISLLVTIICVATFDQTTWCQISFTSSINN